MPKRTPTLLTTALDPPEACYNPPWTIATLRKDCTAAIRRLDNYRVATLLLSRHRRTPITEILLFVEAKERECCRGQGVITGMVLLL